MSKTNVILIQINQTFREGMSPLELYEATRGTWVIGERREEVEYALAVADGEIREVYGVERWDEAGTHKYKTRDQDDVTVEGRWEFSGFLAEDTVRKKCIGHKIEEARQNPIYYIELSELMDSLC